MSCSHANPTAADAGADSCRSREKKKKKLLKRNAAPQEAPLVVQMYDKMRELMDMVKQRLPKYNDIMMRMM